MSLLRVASIGIAVLAAGCALEESTADIEQQIPILPKPGGCDEWGCGTNSPEVDNLGLHDLHGRIGGTPTTNGFTITKIEYRDPLCGACPPITMKEVYSIKAQLFATNLAGFTVGFGSVKNAVGLSIFVKSGGVEYEIAVKGVGRTPYWAHKLGGEMAVTYILEWDITVAPGQKRTWENVCTNPLNDGDPELLGMNRFDSIVFEDDDIDAVSKLVKQRPANSKWFNIGCAGHALAKVHLSGHTQGGQNQHGFHTGWRERQTFLKHVTADYCGTGFSFTVAGQKLNWIDAMSYNDYPVWFVGGKEAEWTEKGARCLNKPRLLANPTPLGMATFPALMNDIKTECSGTPPPPCADNIAANLNGSYTVTGNP
jgi:hypothetical protein